MRNKWLLPILAATVLVVTGCGESTPQTKEERLVTSLEDRLPEFVETNGEDVAIQLAEIVCTASGNDLDAETISGVLAGYVSSDIAYEFVQVAQDTYCG